MQDRKKLLQIRILAHRFDHSAITQTKKFLDQLRYDRDSDYQEIFYYSTGPIETR